MQGPRTGTGDRGGREAPRVREVPGARLRAAAVTVAALTVAGLASCATARNAAEANDAGAPGWERVVYGIEVRDEVGDPVDHPFLGGFNLPRPQLADADGDGDLDLFVQEISDQVMFFRNVGEGAGSEYRWVTDTFEDLSVGEWYRFVDVDLDGDLDLLAEAPYSYLRYYRNDGGAGPASYVLAADTIRDVNGEAVFSDRQNIPNAADIDCDGFLDLLIGRLTGTITRYEAETVDENGVPRFEHITDSFEDIEIVGAMQGSLHGANTMALQDFDQDGDHDLFWGDFFEPGLLLIENTGTCQRPVLRGTPRPWPVGDPVATSGYNAPALGDVDRDGDMDLTMGVLGGAFNPNRTSVENLYQFEQGADGSFSVATTRLIRTIDVGSESFPAFTDLDGDGDLDLLLSNKIETDNTRTGRIYVYENTGFAGAPVFSARGPVPGLPDAYHYAPAFGDLDGDGDDDVILGQWGDEVAYYRNDRDVGTGGSGNGDGDGDGVMPRWTLIDSAAATLTRGRNTTPALGDLDGDGDLDLVVGESSGTLNYYRNDGTRTAPDFQLVSDEFQDIDIGRRSIPAIVDWDGDGDLDLAVGTEASGIRIYLNDGTRSEPVFVETEPFGPPVPTFTAPAFTDLDGDGDLDLVAGGNGGGLTVYRRTGAR
ncbi:MAG: VCBS repeat-containing protein [Gemmatimonadetes bacterium]|nr:VCBS repeat-containing protein [Gemmatimonadota bacterium]MYC92091.1 VCBS repeat-containing protein [Gemmatimonadota bacterium]MYG37180.1 VCBS repeat-containing protein [Gemmatimonadota bacterium]MYJ17035.1 VCBS repeat-containing protein [Gemmatimonadota bacterium]